jgi:predicted nucleic acid-binding OB-fold protein
MTAKSTGKKDRDEAIAIVVDWMRDGLPTKRDFKKNFRSLAEAIS